MRMEREPVSAERRMSFVTFLKELFPWYVWSGSRIEKVRRGYCRRVVILTGRQRFFIKLFERKGRLEMGRKLLSVSGSSPGFFSRG